MHYCGNKISPEKNFKVDCVIEIAQMGVLYTMYYPFYYLTRWCENEINHKS